MKLKVYFSKYLLLLMPWLLFATAVDAKYYIATKDIKVRADKNAKAQVIGTLKNRSSIDVTEVVDDVWFKVTYNDRDGFVQSKYLKEAPENEPAAGDAQAVADDGMIFGLTKLELALIAAGVIAIFILINKLSNYLARRKERLEYKPPVEKVIKTHYWYQCKHCAASLKKDAPPGIAGCSQSLRHNWINLGEVGEHKFICKNCSTIVMVNNDPANEGCPNTAGEHEWKKLEK